MTTILISIANVSVATGPIVHYGDGDEVAISAPATPVRFLLVSGRPIGEPVAWYGPIVMNTQAELRLAFEEYQQGTFIKHPGVEEPHDR